MKNIQKNLNVFLLAVLFGAACLSAFNVNISAQGKLSVRVPAEVTIEFDQVRLGEIAAVTGNNSEAVERLRSISLGFSPRTGMMREIPKVNILLAMAAAGFDESAVALEMPAKVLIKRAAQTIGNSPLREAVEKAILPQFANDHVTVKITGLELPERVDLPTGNVEIRVVNFQGITNFLAPATLSLEVRVDGKVLRRIPANVSVEARAEVLVLNHNLMSGARITESDVRAEMLRLEKPLASYVRDPAQLAGKKLLKNLSESTPLTTDAITADAVIKTGDTVSIVTYSGKMKLAVNGEARANGRIGDRIAVKNTQSGVILQAIVLDAGTVKLNF